MDNLAEHAGVMVELWWRYVFHATWTSSLAAVVVLVCIRLGRRWPAQLRLGLLLIVLVKFAVPPMLTLPVGLFNRLGPSIGWSNTSAKSPTNQALSNSLEEGNEPAPIQGRGAFQAKSVLMAVHLVGFAVIIVSIVGQWIRLATAVRKGRRITAGPLYARCKQLFARLGLRRDVRLVVASRQFPPMAFGVVRPTILLPASVVHRMSPGELNAVFAHELIHHRRGDLWINWLVAVLGAVWWFNPVLWLVNRSVREACETCCDEHLIARGISTEKNYCRTLLKIATLLPKTWQLNAAFGFAERVHPLAVRMERIMDGRAKKRPQLPLAGVGLLVVLAVLILPGLPSAKSDENPPPPGSDVETPLPINRIAGGNDAETGNTIKCPPPTVSVTPGHMERIKSEARYSVNSSGDLMVSQTNRRPMSIIARSPRGPVRQSSPAFQPRRFDGIQGAPFQQSAAALRGNSAYSTPISKNTIMVGADSRWQPRVAIQRKTEARPYQRPKPSRSTSGFCQISSVGFQASPPSIPNVQGADFSAGFDDNVRESFLVGPAKLLSVHPAVSPEDMTAPGNPGEDEKKLGVFPTPSPKTAPILFPREQPGDPPLFKIWPSPDMEPFIELPTPDIHVTNNEVQLLSTYPVALNVGTCAFDNPNAIPSSSMLMPLRTPAQFKGNLVLQDTAATPDPVTILPLTFGAFLLTSRRRRR
ncbi:MAG: hypothetical protein JW849_00420 [Phycisphaerae bacterium]|nr:hypothetical protein [Phycisphaerae bacterium]